MRTYVTIARTMSVDEIRTEMATIRAIKKYRPLDAEDIKDLGNYSTAIAAKRKFNIGR